MNLNDLKKSEHQKEVKAFLTLEVSNASGSCILLKKVQFLPNQGFVQLDVGHGVNPSSMKVRQDIPVLSCGYPDHPDPAPP